MKGEEPIKSCWSPVPGRRIHRLLRKGSYSEQLVRENVHVISYLIISVFKGYHSDVHFSEFYPQNGGENQLAQGTKLRNCHPMYTGRGTIGILFIAGSGRKAYWKRGVGGEGEGAEPIQ